MLCLNNIDLNHILNRDDISQAIQQDSFNVIDVGAIKNNFEFLKAKHINNYCGAVIKADAYGLGIAQIAPSLFNAGCREFFVSTADEGIEARKFLPHGNIYIINGLIPGVETTLKYYNLFPVLNDLGQIKQWTEFCRMIEHKLSAIIQFDTGMHRGGLDKRETQILSLNSEYLNLFTPRYMMSHLACAEEFNHPMNAQQNTSFKKISNTFQNVPATFANSGGIFLGRDYYYDLLRPGAAIFGISPTPYRNNPMQQVLYAYARIIQLQELKKGDVIGYAASYKAEQNMKTAIINVGYANGYPWKLSNKGCVYIGGYKAPTIGHVSMNAIVVDVTNIPSMKVYVGSPVELIGSNINLSTIATQSGTISREILHRVASCSKNFSYENADN